MNALKWITRRNRSGRNSGAISRARPLAMERLEDRSLLATFVVTTTADSGSGSLRQAVLNANGNAGADTIAFDIGGGGVQTIRPTGSGLPSITDTVVIDGTTQPGYAGTPLIELSGELATLGAAHGISFFAGNNPPQNHNVVRGLAINRFQGAGIHVLGVHSNIFVGNFIGTDVTGQFARPNEVGIEIVAGVDNRIGGVAPEDRNVISANSVGVEITHSFSTRNVVQGNYIGLDASGTNPLGNTRAGVMISSEGNTIGGAQPGAGNVISGNGRGDDGGVSLRIGATNNLVQGNYIGTDATGAHAVPNNVGVSLFFGSGNTIGGTTPGARNVISGNSFAGVKSVGAAGNTIQGNYIGADATGNRAVGNLNGLLLAEGDALIGGDAPGAGNLISGNQENGVLLSGNADNYVLLGNQIGTNAAGAGPLGNGGHGVFFERSSSQVLQQSNRVGGVAPGEGNVIAYNGQGGVTVEAGVGNSVRGNAIFDNGGLGIDLGTAGVTENDPRDSDGGANSSQNFPTLLGAIAGPSTRIVGFVDSRANATFMIDFYASAAADPSGYGEGERWLGSAEVVTDADGRGYFTAVLDAITAESDYLTATATDAAGSTSEFSAALAVAASPAVTVGLVGPDVRNTAADAVDITFRDPIDMATLDAGDLSLTLDGSAVPIAGLLTFTSLGEATVRVSGLASSTVGDGAWTLTVNAAGILDRDGNAGSGTYGTNWLMDTTGPVSQVDPLAARQTSLSFTISASGSDPAPGPGVQVSGVASYDLYVSADGAAFTRWTTVPADNPSAVFTGQSDHTYAFSSIARDAAGNVENKTPTAETTTHVPDLTPPDTRVQLTAFPSSSAAVFSAFGTDSGSSGLAFFDVFAEIDGVVRHLARLAAGAPNAHGVHSQSFTFHFYTDGQPHDYRVYCVGVDGNGNREPEPDVATGDDFFLVNARQTGPAFIDVSLTSGLKTTETGDSAAFTVLLTKPPTEDVVIDFTSSDPTEGTAPASITFTPEDWSTWQTVTVTGVDDSVIDGDVAYTIRTTVRSADPQYAALDPADVVIINRDDDAVANIPPSPDAGGPYSIEEGSDLQLAGSATDDGPVEALTYEWDLNGDGVFDDAAGPAPTLSWADLAAWGIADDGEYTLVLRVADGETFTDASATLIVRNAPPVILTFTSSAPGVGDAREGETVQVSATFSDAGALDTHTAVIDWGDGDSSPAFPVNGEVFADHVYSQGGVYTITLTLADDDSGAATAAATAVVTGVGVHNRVLHVVGGDQADRVTLHTTGPRDRPEDAKVRVRANFLAPAGGGRPWREFAATEISQAIVLLGDGNDQAIASHATFPLIVSGGDGNDLLIGGGPALLAGDAGNDTLIAGGGIRDVEARSILIGGDGADLLLSRSGEDILIGGRTAWDIDSRQVLTVAYDALHAILSEWNSPRDAATRRSNLAGEGDGERLNAGYFLIAQQTVLDDEDVDRLFANPDEDWSFVFPTDRLWNVRR